jgi:hypothetical protein
MNLEQLWGPVLEAGRFECPTTRVRKALTLSEVEICLLAFSDVEINPNPKY